MKNACSEIEAVLIRYAGAIRDKDAEALMGCLTEDMTCFDLAPPLMQNPADTHDHAGYKAWFETWDGPIEIASSDLSVEAEDDVGWVSEPEPHDRSQDRRQWRRPLVPDNGLFSAHK